MICFHKPDEENGYLSNWYLSKYTEDGIRFSSMEQYMMHKKAEYLKDEIIAAEILNANDVAYIKTLGRSMA